MRNNAPTVEAPKRWLQATTMLGDASATEVPERRLQVPTFTLANSTGWVFVNEAGLSTTDKDNITQLKPHSTQQVNYHLQGRSFEEVLVQRRSNTWCAGYQHAPGPCPRRRRFFYCFFLLLFPAPQSSSACLSWDNDMEQGWQTLGEVSSRQHDGDHNGSEQGLLLLQQSALFVPMGAKC